MIPPKTENSVQTILIKSHLFFFAKTIGYIEEAERNETILNFV